MQPHELLDRLVLLVQRIESGDDEAMALCYRSQVDPARMRRYYLNCIDDIVKAHTVH